MTTRRDDEDPLSFALFDLMPQLGWTARADGFIDYYNRGWYEYTGTTHADMAGWGWQSVHDPELLPRVLEAWQHSIATGQPFELAFPLRRHDGVFRWFLTRVTAIRNEADELVRWVGINTDIQDQRDVEEQLRGALEREADARRAAEAMAAELVSQTEQVRAAVLEARSSSETSNARAEALEALVAKLQEGQR